MAKKQKRNLQELLEKKRQLQQIQKNNAGALPIFSPETTPNISSPEINNIISPEQKLVRTSSKRVIFRTLVSVAIIALLLVSSTIVGRRTTRFDRFGNWLYQALRLQQS